MLEVLQFVFSSFWVWLGSILMLGVVTQGLVAAVAAILSAVRPR